MELYENKIFSLMKLDVDNDTQIILRCIDHNCKLAHYTNKITNQTTKSGHTANCKARTKMKNLEANNLIEIKKKCSKSENLEYFKEESIQCLSKSENLRYETLDSSSCKSKELIRFDNFSSGIVELHTINSIDFKTAKDELLNEIVSLFEERFTNIKASVFKETLTEPNMCYVISVGGIVESATMFKFEKYSLLKIIYIATKKRSSGKYYGTYLIQALESLAKVNQLQSIIVESDHTSVEFYKKNNFSKFNSKMSTYCSIFGYSSPNCHYMHKGSMSKETETNIENEYKSKLKSMNEIPGKK